jgi:hypothetical protein
MDLNVNKELKTITLKESSINLSDLFKILEILLPNGEWKEYALNVDTLTIQTYPVYSIYQPIYPLYQPIYPQPIIYPKPWWTGDPIICGTTTTDDKNINFTSTTIDPLTNVHTGSGTNVAGINCNVGGGNNIRAFNTAGTC